MATKAELLIMKIKSGNTVKEYAPQTLAEYVQYDEKGTYLSMQVKIESLETVIGALPTDSEVATMITDRIDALTDGAASAYDTFKEVSDYIVEHGRVHDAMTEVINNKAEKTNAIYWGTNISATGSGTSTTVSMNIDGITEYYEGLVIAFKTTSTYCSNININGLGSVQARYRNGQNGGYYYADTITMFVYDGTRFLSVYSYNSDTNAQTIISNSTQFATTAITRYALVVHDVTGWRMLNSTTPFYINEGVARVSSAYAVGAICTVYRLSTFTLANMNLTQTGVTFEKNGYLYVKGRVSGNMFVPESNAPVTNLVPTTEDGYQYLCFAKCYSTSGAELMLNQKIYEYKDGSFREYTPSHFELSNGELIISI